MFNNMKVLALSGWKKSGKSTAAKHLVENHGFVELSFAETLKEEVSRQYGLSLDLFYDQNKKEQPIMSLKVQPKDDFSKKIVETIFKEFRDEYGKAPESITYFKDEVHGIVSLWSENVKNHVNLYWTPRALLILEGSIKRSVTSKYWTRKTIDKIKNLKSNRVCISDLRYKSELEHISSAFNERLKTLRINRFHAVESTDPSERDLDDNKFDYVIENKSTVEELKSKVDKVVDDL